LGQEPWQLIISRHPILHVRLHANG
jgi:hypothetical protein